MKKVFKIALILVIMIGLAWSCKKTIDESSNLTDNHPEQQISKNEQLIRAFIDRIKSHEKAGGEYDTDSAVWYIESTLNYTYSIWDSSFYNIFYDTSSISISLNQNDKIDDSDVSDAYYDFEDSLGVHWDNITGSTKHVIATDITILSNSGGTVVLQLISAIGTGSQVLVYGSFQADDHWIWSDDLGGCGPNTATSSDASDELRFKYMNPIVTQEFANRVYFTDVEIEEKVLPEDYEDPDNSPGYFRLFQYSQEGQITSEPCLPDEDLNYYLYDGLDYIVDDLEPVGFDFLLLDITDDYIQSTGNIHGRRHLLNIWYGEIDQTSNSAATP